MARKFHHRNRDRSPDLVSTRLHCTAGIRQVEALTVSFRCHLLRIHPAPQLSSEILRHSSNRSQRKWISTRTMGPRISYLRTHGSLPLFMETTRTCRRRSKRSQDPIQTRLVCMARPRCHISTRIRSTRMRCLRKTHTILPSIPASTTSPDTTRSSTISPTTPQSMVHSTALTATPLLSMKGSSSSVLTRLSQLFLKHDQHHINKTTRSTSINRTRTSTTILKNGPFPPGRGRGR